MTRNTTRRFPSLPSWVAFSSPSASPKAQDIRTIFHLSPEQAKNVVFSGQVERRVDCATDSVVKIVAVNQRKQLAIIERLLVPGCGGG